MIELHNMLLLLQDVRRTVIRARAFLNSMGTVQGLDSYEEQSKRYDTRVVEEV